MKRKIIIFVLALFLFLGNKEIVYSIDQYTYITGILISEGGNINDDLSVMACLVRNRLNKDNNIWHISKSFSAKYVTPSKADVEFVTKILNDSTYNCLPVYFMYAEWYAKMWSNPNVTPIIKIGKHWYYSYDQYQIMWKKH